MSGNQKLAVINELVQLQINRINHPLAGVLNPGGNVKFKLGLG